MSKREQARQLVALFMERGQFATVEDCVMEACRRSGVRPAARTYHDWSGEQEKVLFQVMASLGLSTEDGVEHPVKNYRPITTAHYQHALLAMHRPWVDLRESLVAVTVRWPRGMGQYWNKTKKCLGCGSGFYEDFPWATPVGNGFVHYLGSCLEIVADQYTRDRIEKEALKARDADQDGELDLVLKPEAKEAMTKLLTMEH